MNPVKYFFNLVLFSHVNPSDATYEGVATVHLVATLVGMVSRHISRVS
jgi:hypothetical protein